uniref:Uncharacterized protein n=1 Tax=Wuchereria bancrofti TaxID=6293 RepID=A0AAF5PKZ7_WUCBA
MVARNVLFLPETEFTVPSVCEPTAFLIALGGVTPSPLRPRLSRTTHQPVLPTLDNKTLRHSPASPFLPIHPSIRHHPAAIVSVVRHAASLVMRIEKE